VSEFEVLLEEGLQVHVSPTELHLLTRWFRGYPRGGGGREGGREGEGEEGVVLLDFNHFLQQFWALGAAAKRRRRKEDAQERFLRALTRRGGVVGLGVGGREGGREGGHVVGMSQIACR